jgi:hypothetical protein
MKLKLFVIGVFAALIIVPTACRVSKIGGYYSYKTECISTELDGSQTVKAWGSGRNRTDAIEQAKKNAVKEILFLGVTSGQVACHTDPIIRELNAEDKYKDYFSKFFADGGPYKSFITDKDGNDLHYEVLKERQKRADQETYAVIIRVLSSDLKQKMITDGIIK